MLEKWKIKQVTRDCYRPSVVVVKVAGDMMEGVPSGSRSAVDISACGDEVRRGDEVLFLDDTDQLRRGICIGNLTERNRINWVISRSGRGGKP